MVRSGYVALTLASFVATSGCLVHPADQPARDTGLENPHLSSPIPGFERLHWGMTIAELRALYPNVVDEVPGSNYATPIFRTYVIGSCEFDVRFRFTTYSNGVAPLSEVGLQLSGGSFNECRDRLRSKLQDRFGDDPKVSKSKINDAQGNPVTETTGLNWEGPGTSAIYVETDFLAKDRRDGAGRLGVTYHNALQTEGARCTISYNDPVDRIRACTLVLQIPGMLNAERTIYLDNRGEAYAQHREYDLAIQDFNDALSINPVSQSAIRNRGLAYARKGNYERALEDFDYAITRGGTVSWNYSLRGDTYRHKGDFERAIQDYDQAIRLYPSEGRFFCKRALARMAKGDSEGGGADITHAQELGSTFGVDKEWCSN